MPRVKGSTIHRARRKKVLDEAKGYFGSKHRLYKTAKEQVMHSGKYAYRDRKQKKRDFRKLWITRINAACRENEISYSKFIDGLNKAGITINRKMLSEIAINDPKAFSELVKVAKDGKAGKIAANKSENTKEVTINKTASKKAKKETVKKAVKEEVKDVDYSKMTVAELKEVAKEKNINVTGMKKAEIVAELSK